MKKKTHEEFLKEVKKNNPYFDDFEFLTEYVDARTKITYRCKKCGNIVTVLPKSLIDGNQCRFCAQRKNRGNDLFYSKSIDLQDKIEFLNVKYENSNSCIECRCKICNQTWTTTAHCLMYDHSGCPYCAHKILDENNNVFETRPDLRKYFVNIEDAKQLFEFSDKAIAFKCPNCGKIKMATMKSMARYGFCCDYCSDGISYPNKVIRNFMSQTQFQNIEFEYSPRWAGRYHYDAYFELNDKKYVVEMDGALGHGNKQYRSSETDVEGLQRDIIKDELAFNHNINVIRVDCKNSDIQYIKNQMQQTVLSNLVNFNLIDWELIDKQSQNSLLIEVCEYYTNKDKDIFNVAKYFKLNPATVRKYVHKGERLGICKYDYEYSECVRLLKANGSVPKQSNYKSNKRQEYWDLMSQKYWEAKEQGYFGNWCEFRKNYKQNEILSRNKDSSTDGSFINYKNNKESEENN